MSELERRLQEILRPVTREYIGTIESIDGAVYSPRYRDCPELRDNLISEILDAVDQALLPNRTKSTR